MITLGIISGRMDLSSESFETCSQLILGPFHGTLTISSEGHSWPDIQKSTDNCQTNDEQN